MTVSAGISEFKAYIFSQVLVELFSKWIDMECNDSVMVCSLKLII